MSKALDDVTAERRRQIEVEGCTEQHDDDEHLDGDLARAAATYALYDLGVPGMAEVEGLDSPQLWPWSLDWLKPKDRRRNLVRAGALIIAEIERLDRADARKDGKP